ncbi:hypothetical protein AcW1_009990 [Taiwanofungus camphoratus]|nr:hypothetical protein AcV5_003175 [Antrodia cinnamomea]KAI0929499.1 hypothetical protein AcV7_005337 [Antrodia cinnamomea]KAI0946557.1 hypothetical protein AcW1_009990 [Antrodia cinnamomea]
MSQSSMQSGDYPEQKHAGAAGLGPEFGKGVSTGDKLDGLWEEAKGKMLRKPDAVEYGREKRTGELKRREQAQDDMNDPFKSVDEDDRRAGVTDEMVPKSDPNQRTAMPPSVKNMDQPTESGRVQQAATVAPEGSDRAERERRGEHSYHYIG